MHNPNVVIFAHRHAGMGCDASELAAVERALASVVPPARTTKVLAESHAHIVDAVRTRVAEGRGNEHFIAMGGSGTLRSLIEGMFGPERAGGTSPPIAPRIGALRCGSVNLVAARAHVPRDLSAAASALATAIARGATRAKTVFAVRDDRGVRYGMAMAGVGALGSIAKPVRRWREHAPGRRRLASIVGIERLTRTEYHLAHAFACVRRWFAPASRTRVALKTPQFSASGRLVTGLIAPARDGTHALDAYIGMRDSSGAKVAHARIEPGQRLLLTCARESIEVLLDGDGVRFSRELCVEPAGTVAWIDAGLS